MTEQSQTPDQSVVFLGMNPPSEEVGSILSELCQGRKLVFLSPETEPRAALSEAIPLVDRKPNGHGVFVIPIEGAHAPTLKVFQGLGKIGAQVQPLHDNPEGVIDDHDSAGIQEWMETGKFPEVDPYADLLAGIDEEGTPDEQDPYAGLLDEAEGGHSSTQEQLEDLHRQGTLPPQAAEQRLDEINAGREDSGLIESTQMADAPIPEPTRRTEAAVENPGGFDFGGGSLSLDNEATTQSPYVPPAQPLEPEIGAGYETSAQPHPGAHRSAETFQPHPDPNHPSHWTPSPSPNPQFPGQWEDNLSSGQPVVPEPQVTQYHPQPGVSGDTSIPLPGEPPIQRPRPIEQFPEADSKKDEALIADEGDSVEETHDYLGGVLPPGSGEEDPVYNPPVMTEELASQIPHIAEADPISRDAMIQDITQRRRYGSGQHVRRVARSASGRCIAVTGVKGGTGKTTSTWMLANTTSLAYTALVKKGRVSEDKVPKVFLLEADLSNPQLFNRIAYNSKGLRMGNQASAGLHVLARKVDEHRRDNGGYVDPDFMYRAIIGASVKISRSNLYVIPAPPSGANTVSPISPEKLRAFCVMAVDNLMQNGETVFVDCDRATNAGYDPLISSICRDRATHVVMTMLPNTKELLAGACETLTQSTVDGYGKKNANVLDLSALHILVNEGGKDSVAAVKESVPAFKSQVKMSIPKYSDLMENPDGDTTRDTWVGNMRSGKQQENMRNRFGVFAYEQLGFHELAPFFRVGDRVQPSSREVKARQQNKPTMGGRIRGLLHRT